MTVEDLSRELRRRRLARGLSLARLAARAGTSAPTLHRYETGWRRFEVRTLEKLASALGCRLELDLVPVREPSGSGRSRESLRRLRRLFWDRPLRRSDLDRYPDWAVLRVLEYGDLEDVRALQAHYGRDRFLDLVAGLHFGSRKTRSFWEQVLRHEGRSCTRRFSREEAESCWTL